MATKSRQNKYHLKNYHLKVWFSFVCVMFVVVACPQQVNVWKSKHLFECLTSIYCLCVMCKNSALFLWHVRCCRFLCPIAQVCRLFLWLIRSTYSSSFIFIGHAIDFWRWPHFILCTMLILRIGYYKNDMHFDEQNIAINGIRCCATVSGRKVYIKRTDFYFFLNKSIYFHHACTD